jgi:hypothetical protein
MMSVPIIILVPLYTFALIGMVLLFRENIRWAPLTHIRY